MALVMILIAIIYELTGNTAEQVYLGAPIPAGSYNMHAASSTTGGLYREFGVTGYPFTNPTGEVSIDQGSLTNYHYFFYNWKVTVGGCPREKILGARAKFELS